MFNLIFMLKVAMKHWVALLLAILIGATVGFGYCRYFREPKYSAKGSIMVTNGEIISKEDSENTFATESDRLNGADITASLNFLQTVIDILETPDIYKQLADETGNVYSYSQLKHMFSIEKKQSASLFLSVSVTMSDPQQAIQYLNAFLELSPDYIKNIVPNTATYITLADGAGIIQYNTTTFMMICALVAFAVVYFIFFIISSSDTIIRDEDALREHLDIDIIGVVPDFSWAKNKESKYYKYGKYYAYGYGGKENVSQKK